MLQRLTEGNWKVHHQKIQVVGLHIRQTLVAVRLHIVRVMSCHPEFRSEEEFFSRYAGSLQRSTRGDLRIVSTTRIKDRDKS